MTRRTTMNWRAKVVLALLMSKNLKGSLHNSRKSSRKSLDKKAPTWRHRTYQSWSYMVRKIIGKNSKYHNAMITSRSRSRSLSALISIFNTLSKLLPCTTKGNRATMPAGIRLDSITTRQIKIKIGSNETSQPYPALSTNASLAQAKN